MPEFYETRLTSQAEAECIALRERAESPLSRGDSTNTNVKTLRLVDDLIDRIIPHNPFNPSRSLAGRLRIIFRVKKSRIRLCYFTSTESKRITILYLSSPNRPRRAGDRHDPYREVAKILSSGEFDRFFDDF